LNTCQNRKDLKCKQNFLDGTTNYFPNRLSIFTVFPIIKLISIMFTGLKKIRANVLDGTLRDAILYALGSNSKHGFRRTNEDKRRAVEKLLGDPEWSQWSDSRIAEICKVSPMTVGKYREVTIKVYSDNRSPERTYTTKQGTTSTMKITNIGKVSKSKSTPDPKPDPPPISKSIQELIPEHKIPFSESKSIIELDRLPELLEPELELDTFDVMPDDEEVV
jgi:hypothetical protein